MPRKFVFADAPHRSVNLVAGERLKDGNLAPANVGNAWAVAVWAKPSGDFSADRGLFSIEHELTLAFPINFPFSNIRIIFRTSGTNNMTVQTWAGLAAPIKDYTWNSWWTQDTWILTMITWNGTSLLAYRNGVAVSPSTMTTDDAGSMGTPPARRIGVGNLVSTGLADNDFQGRIFSAGLWNVAVDAPGVAALYNGGYGANVDWLIPRPGYTASAFLQHYWRTGHYYPPDSGIGRDYGVASTNRRNIMNNAVNIDGSDIVYDWPGKEL